MNEYLKAIETIGKIQEFERDTHIPREVPIGFKLKYQKEFGLLLKLASKSTPKKPYLTPTVFALNGSQVEQPAQIPYCYSCNLLIKPSDKYCSNCGTEIDWSEDEPK